MPDFTPEEKRIIRTLYAANKPLTTKRICEKSDMAWQTGKKYLTILNKKGVVNGKKQGKSFYWWLTT